jgi:hypothetical protein
MSGLNGHAGLLYAANAGPSDPLFASVDTLLHFEGANGSTTFTDVKGKTWTVSGSAQISTAQQYFGTSSGRFAGSGAKISAALGSMSGDFAIEAFVRADIVSAGYRAIWWNAGGTGVGLYQKANTFLWYEGGDRCVSSAISANTWYYVAVVRVSTTVTLYVNAVASGSTYSPSTVPMAATQYVGSNAASTEDFVGYIDEMRVTLAARTISSTPVASFPDF